MQEQKLISSLFRSLEHMKAQYESEIKAIRQKQNIAESALKKLKQQNDDLVKKNEKKNKKLKETEKKLKDIVKSRSWRVTGPLRTVNRNIRKLKKFISAFFPQKTIKDNDSKKHQNAIAGKPLSTVESQLVSIPESDIRISIIVPVYNAADSLANCIISILSNTPRKTRLLLIDDCSPDPEVSRILACFSREYPDRIKTYKNDVNLGFPGTVNRGFELAGRDDVIILNSDTVVPPRWSTRLQLAAYHNAGRPDGTKTGTVSAVSNNSGAFSIPLAGKNPIVSGQTYYSCARMFGKHALDSYPAFHTGHGFCMYIKRDMLDDAGGFDEHSFGSGYGEENDLCMRAYRKGWTHTVADSVYVFHINAQSFGAEKEKRLLASSAIIDSRYPDYRTLNKTIFSKGISKIRENAQKTGALLCKGEKGRPVILYVLPLKTGGTPQTNLDLMQNVKGYYDTLLLQCKGKEMLLFDFSDGKAQGKLIRKHTLSEPVGFETHSSGEYDAVFTDWLVRYSVELIHVRHIVVNSLGIFNIAKRLSIPVVFSFHDFYTVCPSIKLLDASGRFHPHGVPTNFEIQIWRDIDNSLPEWDETHLLEWQKRFNEKVFPLCSKFITTAQSAKNLLLDNYSSLKERERDFIVIPHGRNFKRFAHTGGEFPPADGVLCILVPGNIDIAKGASVVRGLLEADLGKNKLHFHFFGNTVLPDEWMTRFSGSITLHGAYKRDDFIEKVSAIQPHIAAIFSIWPETWCHTLTESWSTGLPVAAIDTGAVGDRLDTECCGGWKFAPDSTAEEIYSKLVSLLDNPAEYKEKIDNVFRWQETSGRQNDLASMAEKYVRIYDDLLTGISTPEKPLLRGKASKSMLMVPAGISQEILSGFHSKDTFSGIIIGTELHSTDFRDMEKITILNNAVPENELAELVNVLSFYGIKYDVVLWNVAHTGIRTWFLHFKDFLEKAEKIYSRLIIPDEMLTGSIRAKLVNETFLDKLKRGAKAGFLPKTGEKNMRVAPSSNVRLCDWETAFSALGGKVIRLNPNNFKESDIGNFDVLFVCRDAIPHGSVRSFISACSKQGIPYYMDIDDNLFVVDEFEHYSECLEQLVQSAAGVSVSVPSLAETMKKYNRNIILRQNRLNKELWHDEEKHSLDMETLQTLHEKCKGTNIVYYGSRTHAQDIAILSEVIPALREKFDVEFFLIRGTDPEDENIKNWTPILTKQGEYKTFIRGFRALADFMDIGLAPLLDGKELNPYKSPLKYLEGSACGLAMICDKTVYSSIVENNIDGIIVPEHTPEAWYAALSDLIENTEKRRMLAKNAQEKVLKDWLITPESLEHDLSAENALKQ